MAVHIIDHPLVQHKLSIMRNKETSTIKFRELLKEISMLMGYEITKDFPLTYEEIETPLMKMNAPKIEGKKVVIAPILRAGLGMVEGLTTLIPSARVGHIGMYRNEETFKPTVYFFKVPKDINKREVLVLDPMLATGGSGIDTIQLLKEKGARNIKFLCIIAAPEGIKALEETHPDVQIYAASLDERLNEHAYIVPGLGDAGDRIFGIK